ncbi:MAG: hypothetical protein SVX43_11940 [Cyanobacteriota bacterium]|nr:hypothetical protein [Cyanobacteriota bacterium]
MANDFLLSYHFSCCCRSQPGVRVSRLGQASPTMILGVGRYPNSRAIAQWQRQSFMLPMLVEDIVVDARVRLRTSLST